MAEVATLEKAQPDTSPLNVGNFASQASQKVQLDIDDAPFLMDYEESPPPPALAESDELDSSEDDAETPKGNRKKWLIIGLAVLLLLLLGSAIAWYFLSSPPPAPPVQPEPTIIVVPSEKSLAGPQEYKVEFAPFMVEQRVGNTVNFLQAMFTGIAASEAVVAEANTKRLLLRDSIYYYLRNKTHEYLVDPNNTRIIKQDLQDIVNGILTQGKMEDILLINYILK